MLLLGKPSKFEHGESRVSRKGVGSQKLDQSDFDYDECGPGYCHFVPHSSRSIS